MSYEHISFQRLQIYDAYKARQRKLFARQKALYCNRSSDHEGPRCSQRLQQVNLQLEHEINEVRFRLDNALYMLKERENELETVKKSQAENLRRLSDALETASNLSRDLDHAKIDTADARNQLHITEALKTEDNERAQRELLSLQVRIRDLDGVNSELLFKQQGLLEIESALTDAAQCKICYEFISDPIILACGHIFCSPCINSWKRLIDPIGPLHKCPLCRAQGKAFEGSTLMISKIFELVSAKFPPVVEDGEILEVDNDGGGSISGTQPDTYNTDQETTDAGTDENVSTVSDVEEQ